MTISNYPKYKILLVDDEKEQLDKINEILKTSTPIKDHIESIDIRLVDPKKGAAEVAKEISNEQKTWNIILADLFMPTPPKGGLLIADALISLFGEDKKPPVKLILISNKDKAASELRAYIPKYNKLIDWYTKPQIRPEDYLKEYLCPSNIWCHAITEAIKKLTQDSDTTDSPSMEDMEICLSGRMKIIKSKLDRIIEGDFYSVLILGESGSGKEVVAHYLLERLSKKPRKKIKFHSVNCSSYTDELCIDLLFGHEKGSYSGAYEMTQGIFETVDDGIVFLDEIGKASPRLQDALLKVADKKCKEFSRIGNTTKIEKFKGRIICAASEPLD